MDIERFKAHCYAKFHDLQVEEEIRRRYKYVYFWMQDRPTLTKEVLMQSLETWAGNLDNAAWTAVPDVANQLGRDAALYREMSSVLSGQPDETSKEEA